MNKFGHCSTVSEARQVLKRRFVGHDRLVRQYFHKNPYPSEAEMKKIANQLNVGVDKVKNWFYHQQRTAVKKGEHFNIQNQRVIKGRKRFNWKEHLTLKKAYESSSGKIPNSKEIEKLAVQLKVKDLQRIKTWFRNQRFRMRQKQSKFTFSSSRKSSQLKFIDIA